MLALLYLKQGVAEGHDRNLIAVSEDREQLNQEIDRLCRLSTNNITKMQEYEISRSYYISTARRSLKGFLEGNRNALISEEADQSHCGLRRQLENTLISNIVEKHWHFFLPDDDRWKRFIDESKLRPTEKVPVLPPYPKEPILGMTYVKDRFFIEKVTYLK